MTKNIVYYFEYCEFLNGFIVVIICQCVVCQIFCNKNTKNISEQQFNHLSGVLNMLDSSFIWSLCFVMWWISYYLLYSVLFHIFWLYSLSLFIHLSIISTPFAILKTLSLCVERATGQTSACSFCLCLSAQNLHESPCRLFETGTHTFRHLTT